MLQIGGVIQRDLVDDLQSKIIKVAIAGETHYEIPEEEEVNEWRKHGINVFYEASPLPHSGGSGEITPDPISLRLAFAWSSLVERVRPHLVEVSKPGKSAVSGGLADAEWVLKYLIPVLISDLGRVKGKNPAFVQAMDLLKELKPLLKGKKSKVLGGDEELARRVLASKLKRNMDSVSEIMAEEHSKSHFAAIPYQSANLSVERSRQMLRRVNKYAGSMEKTIYKVGSNHARDMRQQAWKVKAGVRVYTREEYKAEYESLKLKPSKPSAVSKQVVVSPPSKQVVVSPPSKQVVVSPPSKQVVVSPPTKQVVVSAPSKQVVVSPPSKQVVVSPPSKQVVVSPPVKQVVVSPPVKQVVVSPPIKPSVGVSSSSKQSVVVSSSGSSKPKQTFTRSVPSARVRPTWIPDDWRTNCNRCFTEFGFFTRRHHCRACGDVYCNNCCSRKRTVALDVQAVEDNNLPTVAPVLVCNGCF